MGKPLRGRRGRQAKCDRRSLKEAGRKEKPAGEMLLCRGRPGGTNGRTGALRQKVPANAGKGGKPYEGLRRDLRYWPGVMS